MAIKCCIPGCTSTELTGKLFKFPADKMLFQAWKDLILAKYPFLVLRLDRTGRCQQWCCSLHFEPKYIRPNGSRLKYSIPSLFSISEINSRIPAHPISFSVHREEEDYNDTSSKQTLSSEEEHHIYCSYHDHGYAQIKKAKLMVKQDFSKDEEVTSTETGLNTVHYPGDCSVNVSLGEAETHSYPTSSTLPGDGLQIQRIRQEGVINHDLYIAEVVDDILSPRSDAQMMQIEPSEIVQIEPSEIVQIEPSEIVQIEPSEIVQIEPSEIVQIEPSEIVQIEPSEIVQIEPSEIIQIEPSEIIQIEPSEIIIDEKEFQKDVIHCFEQVSTTGLSEHDRKDLTDKHLVPGNCLLFGAPALNPEVKAALSRMEIERDQAIEHKQAILASAIANLVEAIGVVVSSKDNKAELLSLLVDTGRLLCDCQYHDTTSRRNCIIEVFHTDIQETLKKSKIDSYLFGKSISLQHNLTTAEATYKSGADLTMALGPKTSEVIHNSGAEITMAPGLKTGEVIYNSDTEMIMAPKPKTAEMVYNSEAEITMTPRPKTAEVIDNSGAEIIMAPRPKTTKAIHNSGAEITMAPELKSGEVIYNSGSEIIMAPRPKTTKAIHNSAAEITMAPGLKTGEVIYNSGSEIIMAPRPKTTEAIHNSGAEITMAPGLKTVKVIYNSGSEIIMEPKLKTTKAIHNSGAEITMEPRPKKTKTTYNSDAEIDEACWPTTSIRNSGSEIIMAPRHSTTKVNVTKKSEKSYDYKGRSKDFEGAENIKYNFQQWSPS